MIHIPQVGSLLTYPGRVLDPFLVGVHIGGGDVFIGHFRAYLSVEVWGFRIQGLLFCCRLQVA